MKASFAAVFAATAVVLVSAFAGTGTSSKIHPDSLARVEAITSYCEKADPDAAPEYVTKLAAATRGHSDDEIEWGRQSARYQAARLQAHQTLSETTQETGVRACAEFLAQK